MEGNQSNWQNPYSEDKDNPPEDTYFSRESFSDEEGRGDVEMGQDEREKNKESYDDRTFENDLFARCL